MVSFINKNKIFLLTGFIVFLMFFAFFNVCLAYNFEEDSGLNPTGKESGYEVEGSENTPAETRLISRIILVIQAILSLVGVFFLILMMYGGYIWLTAQGNEQQVEKAKNIIVSAIIGLVVIMAAYAISWFFINAFGSQTLRR